MHAVDLDFCQGGGGPDPMARKQHEQCLFF